MLLLFLSVSTAVSAGEDYEERKEEDDGTKLHFEGDDDIMFKFRFRRGGKDITSLKKADLLAYRLVVEKIRGSDALDEICSDWSLSRFQSPEVGPAFLPFARKFLRRLEVLIGHHVPIWDFTDSYSDFPLDIFVEEDFVVDKHRNRRFNPLRSGLVPDGTETQRGHIWTISKKQIRGTLAYAVSRDSYEEFSAAVLSALNNVHYAVRHRQMYDSARSLLIYNVYVLDWI